MSEKMTITRGLAELKMLDKRIIKQVQTIGFTDVYQERSKKLLLSKMTGDEFDKTVKADWTSLTDMMDRRRKIKSAIIKSNAKEKVTLCKEKMTVAEAIEMKSSIDYKKQLLGQMQREITTRKNNMEAQTAKLEDTIEKMLQANYGVEKKSDKEDYDKIAKPFIEANELHLRDPLSIEKKIEEFDLYVDEFEKEVDFVLTESNSKTEITI